MCLLAGAVRVGLVDGELRINPNVKEVNDCRILSIIVCWKLHVCCVLSL